MKLNFNSNFAGADGGAIAVNSQSEIRLNSNAVVTFTSNRAVDNGGSIYIIDHSNINITGDTVVHLSHYTVANYGGGAIYLYYTYLFTSLFSSLETTRLLITLEEVFSCMVVIFM